MGDSTSTSPVLGGVRGSGTWTPNVIARSEQTIASSEDITRDFEEQASKSDLPFQSQLDSVSSPPQYEDYQMNPQHPYYGHMAPYDMSAMRQTLPDGMPQGQGSPMPQPQPTQQILNDARMNTQYQQNQGLSPQQFVSPIMGKQGQQQNMQGMLAYPPSPALRGGQQMPNLPIHPQYPQFTAYPPQYAHPGMYHAHAPMAYPRPGVNPYESNQGGIPYYVGGDQRGFVTGMPTGGSPSPQLQNGQFRSSAPARRGSETEATPSYPRGPPRKPKQSGHALWVGNLPPGANILDLKDHFSREARRDIESVFLISKSNCAFINYRTEPACVAAVSRFHDSTFNGARLVCRLRRGSSTGPLSPSPRRGLNPESGTTANTNAATDSPEGTSPSPGNSERTETPVGSEGPQKNEVIVEQDAESMKRRGSERVPDRYFIVKSLTTQDLEASVRDGIWATQSHNEKILSDAYNSADNVYLIFSANKSGEYFGYARMKSVIDTNTVTFNPRAQPESADPSDGPTSVTTPATKNAPKGHIIDDSARGTIFWEADLSDAEKADKDTHDAPDLMQNIKQGQDWGKPFQIEWMSTNRLPFYRTRGLRNMWNANREVKIARDGTELEPGVGKRLTQMFSRSQSAGQEQYLAGGEWQN